MKTNQTIAMIFENMATLLELKDENVFKIKAYRKAADNIINLAQDLSDLRKEDKLSQIPGIGEALRDKIIEYLDTGKVAAYEELKKEIPESLLELVRIPSVGPRTAKLLFQELKITNVEMLEKAAQAGRLLDLPGIKEKTVENILKGIRLLKSGQERMDLATATYLSEQFVEALEKIPQVRQISVAGSLRRGKETIRDIDILIDSSKPQVVMDAFVKLPQVKEVQAHGETKSSVLTHENIQVDLRVVERNSFGAALLYFTGSKNFNVKLRQIAINQNKKVSEYGVFSVQGRTEKLLASKTEKDVFEELGLKYFEPELREDIGAAELFSGEKIPKLVEAKEVRGDLHVHSTWSDGRDSILDLVQVGIAKGYDYMAISDHSPRLRVARGVSAEDLKIKKKEIDSINQRFKNFRVLLGTEVEIDSEGNIDYNTKILSEFDVVIAAIHSGFEQSPEQLTRRIVKACQNKYVHAIAHPTGVHLGKRDPCDIDLKEICKVAVDTNTFLEINAFPIRFDLNSSNVYFARQMGVKFVINTDAHAVDHLDFMRFGVTIARRGWLRKKDVINTLTLPELLKVLTEKRKN